MAIEPLAHFGVFVRGIIVEDHVNGFPRGQLCFDHVEEADELLMPMALHVAADDRSVEHVERGKERGRPVALIIVRHRAGPALLERQAGLGPVERLKLAFLVE